VRLLTRNSRDNFQRGELGFRRRLTAIRL